MVHVTIDTLIFLEGDEVRSKVTEKKKEKKEMEKKKELEKRRNWRRRKKWRKRKTRICLLCDSST